MRVLTSSLLLLALIIGVSAQIDNPGNINNAGTITINVSDAPSSTSEPGPERTSCSTDWDPSCSFLCGDPGQQKICSQTFYYNADTGGGCSICPSTAKECPQTPSADCAYVCKDAISGTSVDFCANKDYSIDGVTCTQCPTQETTSSADSEPVSTTPSNSDSTSMSEPPESSSESAAESSTGEPTASPTESATEPATESPAQSTEESSTDTATESPTSDAATNPQTTGTSAESTSTLTTIVTTVSGSAGQPGGVNNTTTSRTSKNAGGESSSPVTEPASTSSSGSVAGNSTTPSRPGNSTSSIPVPTFSSDASVINIGGAIILGLLCIMFTL
ncbi:hypothetical protein TWF694_003761 [Orbilia ellipsospora]|uniref:Uncharacterized protein n=1 Tax=Orbilia ellipsospora TaxID=2528407 RepID=A0AAV9X1D4_9PEZI